MGTSFSIRKIIRLNIKVLLFTQYIYVIIFIIKMEYGGRLCFLITVLFIVYHAIIIESEDIVYNVKAGIVAVCLVFMAQSYLKPYESKFCSWPPDWVIRIVSRIGLLYIGMLVFLLF